MLDNNIVDLLRTSNSLPDLARRSGESEHKIFCDTMRVLGFELATSRDHAPYDRRLPDGRNLQAILSERGNNVTALAFHAVVFADVHFIFFTGSPDIVDERYRDGAFFGMINFKTGEMTLRKDFKLICYESDVDSDD